MSAYAERFAHHSEGLEALSTGICPSCESCADSLGIDVDELNAGIESGELCAEAGFSWHACDLCGSNLGGDREPWHALIDGALTHGDSACVDCSVYIANGDLPSDD